MAKMKVLWTENAINDLNKIINYWNNHNQSHRYSKKLLQQIRLATEKLSMFPGLGIQSTHPAVRVLYSGNYEIFYKLNNNIIYILMIWDSRRDPISKPTF